MSTMTPNLFLKRALIADACVSGAVALLQLTAAGSMHDYTGLSIALLEATGVFLVAYVGLLSILATRAQLRAGWLWLVIVGNLGWALGAVAVSSSTGLPALGRVFALIQALAVVAFAGLEYVGLARSEQVAGRVSSAA